MHEITGWLPNFRNFARQDVEGLPEVFKSVQEKFHVAYKQSAKRYNLR